MAMKICSRTVLDRIRKDGLDGITTATVGAKLMTAIEDYIGKGEEISIQERMIIKGMYKVACLLAGKKPRLSERDFWR